MDHAPTSPQTTGPPSNGAAGHEQNGTLAVHPVESISLFELAEIFLRRWRMIGLIVGGSMLTVLALTFILPTGYRAVATVLPPEQEGGGLGALVGSGGGSLSGGLRSLGHMGGNAEVFVDILSSRTVADTLISRFDLTRIFAVDHPAEAVIPLSQATDITSADDGLITLTVTLQTGFLADRAEKEQIRQLSADVANRYVVELDRINRRTAVEHARFSRTYISEQLIQTRRDLDSAYAGLQAFQQTNRAVNLGEQVRVGLAAAASLKAEILREEFQLRLLERDRGPLDPFVRESQAKIAELRRQYQAMQFGGSGGGRGDFTLPIDRVPALARQQANLERDVKIQEELYQFLQQQYHYERIQEARDVPTVRPLDEAVPPYRRASPKRFLLLLATGLLSSVLAVAVVLLTEFAEREKRRSPESYAKLRASWRRPTAPTERP